MSTSGLAAKDCGGTSPTGLCAAESSEVSVLIECLEAGLAGVTGSGKVNGKSFEAGLAGTTGSGRAESESSLDVVSMVIFFVDCETFRRV